MHSMMSFFNGALKPLHSCVPPMAVHSQDHLVKTMISSNLRVAEVLLHFNCNIAKASQQFTLEYLFTISESFGAMCLCALKALTYVRDMYVDTTVYHCIRDTGNQYQRESLTQC